MKPPKKKALKGKLRHLKPVPSPSNNRLLISRCSFLWRKAKGLLLISDHIFLYRGKRHPRGGYKIPLQEDLIQPPLKRSKSDRLLPASRESERKNESES